MIELAIIVAITLYGMGAWSGRTSKKRFIGTMNGMTKAQRIGAGALGVMAFIISIFAYMQPRGTTGRWQSLVPVVLGVMMGYSLCVVVTNAGKKT